MGCVLSIYDAFVLFVRAFVCVCVFVCVFSTGNVDKCPSSTLSVNSTGADCHDGWKQKRIESKDETNIRKEQDTFFREDVTIASQG